MGTNLLTSAQQAEFRAAISNVFWTFARSFQIYIAAQVIHISTSAPASPFAFRSQNTPVSASNPAVQPQWQTINGCILYGKDQPWPYITADGGSEAQQLKIRNSDGKVRIKVEQDGYDLMKVAKTLQLDGMTFNLISTARPHSIVGNPDRFTFHFERQQ